jgi:hypothetical protein
MSTIINYASYLLNTVKSEQEGSNLFTNPGSFDRIHATFEFIYEVNPSVEELDAQSEMFAKYVLSYLGYQTRAVQKRWDYDDLQNVSNAYKYSFYKALFYAIRHSKSEHEFMPGNSLVFGGHKIMYDTIRNRDMWNFDNSSDCEVSLKLIVAQGVEENLANPKICPFAADVINNGDSELVFYDKKCEYVLQVLKQKYDKLDIRELYKTEPKVSAEYPLGNSCYEKGNDFSKILYLNDREMYKDILSTYWGTACFIKISEEQQIDEDDRYYRSCSSPKDRNMLSRKRSFEIESVTNFRPIGDSQRRSSSGDGKPSGSNSGKSSGNKGPNNPNEGNGGSSPNKGGENTGWFGNTKSSDNTEDIIEDSYIMSDFMASKEEIGKEPTNKNSILSVEFENADSVTNDLNSRIQKFWNNVATNDNIEKIKGVVDLYNTIKYGGRLNRAQINNLERVTGESLKGSESIRGINFGPLKSSQRDWEETRVPALEYK